MATHYAESAPSLTSKSSRFNVYQTDGKPLSEEAIYKAKLKYGIFNNPAKVSLGVDPSASDTAAVLATNTDLSIHPYSKELSSEAAHAALIAKPESILPYKRNSVAPEAEYAALSAKSLKFPFNDENATPTVDHLSSDAASSVLSKPSKYVAKDILQDIYDFDDIRSGKATLSQFSNVKGGKSAKSLSSKKDYRSGITTSNLGAETSRKMNIGDISKAATKSANNLLNKRLTPEKDFRSGIKTVSSNNVTASSANHSVYINNIHNQAIKASERELKKSMSRTRTMGIETPSDKGLVVNPANYAASALKFDPHTQGFESTVKDNTLVTNSLYAVASKKAKAELTKLDAELSSKMLYVDPKSSEMAYKIAQENAAKRKAASVAPGEVNLGHGLKMKYSDVEQIASSLVTPALTDMELRIVETKHLDQERKELPAKIRQRNEEFKEEQRQAQIALEKKRAGEAAARRDQLALDKQALEDEHEKHKSELSEKLTARQEELDQQVEEEEAEKKIVDGERAEKLKVLKDAKAEKDEERRVELHDMQSEKDEDISPLLKELDTETSNLQELTSTREEHEKIFNEEQSKVDSLQNDLDDTLSKIEIMNKRLEELESGLDEVSGQEAEITSAALAAETLLSGEGKEKESNLESLANERKDLESKRTELHGQIEQKANELRELSLAHHNEEKDINEIYPEHLRKEVIKPEDFDDDDLNDSKYELDDAPIEIPAEVESLPETFPEEVWPKVEEPEPEVDENEEEKIEGGFAKAAARPVVPKKTWQEIRDNADIASGDPLANIPTQEKPPMADIVNDDKIKASIANTNALKSSKGKNILAKAKTAATSAVRTSTHTVPVIKSDSKTTGFLGFFRTGPKQQQQQKQFAQKAEPVDVEATKKKFKGLQDEPAVEEKPAVKKDSDGVDDDVFSGFSQGSEVEA